MPSIKFLGFDATRGLTTRQIDRDPGAHIVSHVDELNAAAPAWAFKSSWATVIPSSPAAAAAAEESGPLALIEDWAFVWASFTIESGPTRGRLLVMPMPVPTGLRRADTGQVALPLARYANAFAIPLIAVREAWTTARSVMCDYPAAEVAGMLNTMVTAVAPTGEECDALTRSIEILANRSRRLVVRAQVGGVIVEAVEAYRRQAIGSDRAIPRPRVMGIFDGLEYPDWVTR